ncbi:DMT family transporter [Undibacterium oligocarboniphilum]|uniref:EamA family transporter n=1 Tax=Undibacterium oligocarboniphilum TaxID=666702 RepID=A0A850QL84_9BURK|nr:EamA family transporter [Undibacterium oligocarboniphilum]MBC3870314.1 EamA family transporter [Undibacterium oligocarboniphilum]NVO78305.1 EamA family transporter [Undibacterium oligocarboniphilum]
MKDRSVVPYVALHFAVFLFGSAGVLSKMLVVSSLLLVFGRTLFATLSLIPLLLVQREFSFRAVPKTVILCGVLLAVHWLSFFAAMKAAPVAYGLMGFASFPLFVTWLEPWLFKEQRDNRDWYAALAVVIGMIIMVSDTGGGAGATPTSPLAGLMLGVFSGLSFALLVLANRWQGGRIAPFRLAFLQNSVATLTLLPLVLADGGLSQISACDWWGLVLMGVVFTAISHGLFMYSLRHVSTRFASLMTSLEPVYGIGVAYLVLHEMPGLRALIGCAIVISATVAVSYWHGKAH